jgi:hypothetical protein
MLWLARLHALNHLEGASVCYGKRPKALPQGLAEQGAPHGCLDQGRSLAFYSRVVCCAEEISAAG